MVDIPSGLHYIAVEGVIGAGKTELAHLLAERLPARLVLERFEDNPFLPKFYEDPERYAFQTQICFLLNRYKQQKELIQPDLFYSSVVSDYIFEKDKIFAYLTLRDDELKLYESILNTIERGIPQPDLVIYLQSSIERLMENIKKRGRPMEKNISKDYLKELNEAYNYFFFRYKASPLLIVKTTEADFVNNKEQFERLLKHILKKNRPPVEYFDPVAK